jgi:hypothetical protein
MENERVAKTVSTVGSLSSAAWKRIGSGVGFIKAKIAEVGETVGQAVQVTHRLGVLSCSALLRSALDSHLVLASPVRALPLTASSIASRPILQEYNNAETIHGDSRPYSEALSAGAQGPGESTAASQLEETEAAPVMPVRGLFLRITVAWCRCL